MDRDNRLLVIILAVLVLIVVLGSSFGAGMMGPGMMGPGMMGPGMMGRYGPPGGRVGASGWAWGLAIGLGWLARLAFWGAVIVGLVLLVRWLTSLTAFPGAARESPLDVLRRRYAAGEITREEYEQMRQVLER